MNNLIKIKTIGLPAAIGLGLAWVGVRIMRNERKLATREMELRLQLDEIHLVFEEESSWLTEKLRPYQIEKHRLLS